MSLLPLHERGIYVDRLREAGVETTISHQQRADFKLTQEDADKATDQLTTKKDDEDRRDPPELTPFSPN